MNIFYLSCVKVGETRQASENNLFEICPSQLYYEIFLINHSLYDFSALIILHFLKLSKTFLISCELLKNFKVKHPREDSRLFTFKYVNVKQMNWFRLISLVSNRISLKMEISNILKNFGRAFWKKLELQNHVIFITQHA